MLYPTNQNEVLFSYPPTPLIKQESILDPLQGRSWARLGIPGTATTMYKV